MNNPKARNHAELSPVGGTLHPLQIVSQEGIYSGSCVHDRVGKHSCGVANRVAFLHSVPNVFEDEEIRVVMADEELKMQSDGGLARQDLIQFRPPRLILRSVPWFHFRRFNCRHSRGFCLSGSVLLHCGLAPLSFTCCCRFFCCGLSSIGCRLRLWGRWCWWSRWCGAHCDPVTSLDEKLVNLVLEQIVCDLVCEQRLILSAENELVENVCNSCVVFKEH
mmetsp:Transcript_20270/g.24218  ORF Transcript_20270/g.24218 Transcript_20270/m.24218 type:complete len:220 (+) Transcript_20270:1987-2646(+)